MATLAEIKTAVEDLNKANTLRWDVMEQDIKTLAGRVEVLQDRVEDREAKAMRPACPASAKAFTSRDAREHRDRFERWLRSPGDGDLKNQLSEFERKAMTIGSNADGGFAVPEEIAREVERLELEFSPVRRLVKVMRVGSNDNKHLVNIRGATSGWVGESGSRTATSTPQLRERAPTMGELYAYHRTGRGAGMRVG